MFEVVSLNTHCLGKNSHGIMNTYPKAARIATIARKVFPGATVLVVIQAKKRR